MIKRWFPPLRAESDKLRNLDLLRFIAAYGVVLYHFRVYAPDLHISVHASWDFLPLFVDLFFAISGFVISFVYFDRMSTWSEFGAFMKRRAARLVPLHWLTLFAFAAIGLSIYLGVQVKEPDRYDWQCFLPNLFLIHSLSVCDRLTFNYPSWSISVEILLYCLFPVFCAVARRSPWLLIAAALTIIAWLAGTEFRPANAELYWIDYTYAGGFARGVPSFLIGICLFLWRFKLAWLPKPELAMYVALVVFLALGLAGATPFYLLPLVYIIVAVAISADVQGKISALPARVSVIGQLTYSIYMLHPLAATILLTFVGGRLLHLGPVAMSIWCVVVAALLTVLAYFSFAWFETPMRRWISSFKLRAGERTPAPEQRTSGVERQY
ncbi:acyltransferase family protein [Dongia sedimenti]|uniref:Acyltransferase n=1 Tax=Dongia sedimenti TaxID=3064282 RepID=A0ABU0YR91_9PROT|nr:acyltransferase [Rhodospirillaceae bacterium R-7]